ncbi:MAG: hypothetical protein DRI75_12715 [Bacteroidetes bacterium]|nr:MAG: hypothetical protein DRI75_12715 [Bacteroidota bacterium]
MGYKFDFISTSSFDEFVFNNMTGQQKLRTCIKYELNEAIKNKGDSITKMDIYRIISNKYGYTVERIKEIATQNLKKSNDE